ncbi:MAG: DUF550 domain-containing protein [Bordetella sp.]|nr:DUF550 domain-containing protein [Bordetella sp.]
MSTSSPERLRELAQQMRDAALGTTGRDMHVCVNSGDLADLLQELEVPGFDVAAHLARQAAFSARAFGPGRRTKGVCDHIRKELIEVEAAPADLSEWIDVVILALDGAWRTGARPNQIIEAMVAKQSKNERRVWPDWRTADPDKAIEHDRSVEGKAAC